MNTQICPKCEARWVDGQHYWHTGALGDPHDLAGLVCNQLGDTTCINPCNGSESGDTWEKRANFIDKNTEDNESGITDTL